MRKIKREGGREGMGGRERDRQIDGLTDRLYSWANNFYNVYGNV